MTGSKNYLKSKTHLLRLFLPGFLILFGLKIQAQTSNSDFERIKLSVNETEFSGMAISPDNRTIALCYRNSTPVSIVDWNDQTELRQVNAGKWATGSTVSFSSGGKYLLLQETGYSDLSQNADRKISFEIADVQTGISAMKFENVQDVIISPDEKQAIVLNDDEVTFCDLPSGKKDRSFHVPGAGNAIALNADGKVLAVSQQIAANDYKMQFGKDKKGLKNVVRLKQIVSFFNAESGTKIKTIPEFYDVVYNLGFLPEDNILLVYQTPDIREQINNKRLSYINLIDGTKMEPLRKGFTSMSLNQPELKISSDHRYFAINSKGNRFQEIHLYTLETGNLEKRFELGHRLFEKVDGEKLINGSRPAFVFLPDNQSILIALGNQLIKWNINF